MSIDAGLISNLNSFSPIELLRLHNAAAQELRRRGLTRSANNPLGDMAEHLFCHTFGWKIALPSMAAADAVDSMGIRYQIKARRLDTPRSSRQLSAIRNIADKGFDLVAAVLFSSDYEILRAAFIPYDVVNSRSRHNPHTNSAIFILADNVWDIEDVTDITIELRLAADKWLGTA